MFQSSYVVDKESSINFRFSFSVLGTFKMKAFTFSYIHSFLKLIDLLSPGLFTELHLQPCFKNFILRQDRAKLLKLGSKLPFCLLQPHIVLGLETWSTPN